MASPSDAAAWSLLKPAGSGHKLRLSVPDTALITNKQLTAWFYTDLSTGVVHEVSRSQLSTAALLHKLTGLHAPHELNNPEGWVAVAYFSNHITRLVNAQELEELLTGVHVGPHPGGMAAVPNEDAGLQLQMLQGYIPPQGDLRFITTFGGVEGAVHLTQAVADRCSSFARTADACLQKPSDPLPDGIDEAVTSISRDCRGGGEGSSSASNAASPSGRVLLAEGGGNEQAVQLAAPGSVARPAASAVQSLISWLDKAHGLRVQGIVAEFIKDMRSHLWLTGLHSIVLDPKLSAGSAATFTDRWTDFMAGAGAGGNPNVHSTANSDSYSLWMQQPLRPGDSVTAQLAGQLEAAKEAVQQYADLAEAAKMESISATSQAAQQVQEQLAQDRATMATMLRSHQHREQQLEEEVTRLQQHNADLRLASHQLTARLDEEAEVVSALRAQLVDYKLQMSQLQLQTKKGRGLSTEAGNSVRRGMSGTTAGQQQPGQLAPSMLCSSSGASNAAELLAISPRSGMLRSMTPAAVLMGSSGLGRVPSLQHR
eukprot:gene11561-11704_t